MYSLPLKFLKSILLRSILSLYHIVFLIVNYIHFMTYNLFFISASFVAFYIAFHMSIAVEFYG